MNPRRVIFLTLVAGVSVVALSLVAHLPTTNAANVLGPGIAVTILALRYMSAPSDARFSARPALVTLLASFWLYCAAWFTAAILWLMWSLVALAIVIGVTVAAFAQLVTSRARPLHVEPAPFNDT